MVKTYKEVIPKCGDIWMCDLGDEHDSVQGGYRPVFILSNNKNNEHSPNINVIPLTSRMNKKSLPVHVEVWNYESCGLKVPSTVMCEALTTIPAYKLKYKMGEIADKRTLFRICQAIMIQFPILTMR